jgi:RimJ/RimL family protein N-acetyltransferase
MSGIELTTDRLVGAPVSIRDTDDVAALWSDDRVTATLGGTRSRDLVEQVVARWIAHFDEHGWGPYTWRDRATGAFVGWCGLQWTTIAGERAIELLYAIDADRWGQGLTTEASAEILRRADGTWSIEELVAFTLVTNKASQRVMEKSGFVYERDLEHANLPHVLYRRRRPRGDPGRQATVKHLQ